MPNEFREIPRPPNGYYHTEARSEIRIFGKYGGGFEIDFNWCDEMACCDCTPEFDFSSGILVWHCDLCNGGSALIKEGKNE